MLKETKCQFMRTFVASSEGLFWRNLSQCIYPMWKTKTMNYS